MFFFVRFCSLLLPHAAECPITPQAPTCLCACFFARLGVVAATFLDLCMLCYDLSWLLATACDHGRHLRALRSCNPTRFATTTSYLSRNRVTRMHQACALYLSVPLRSQRRNTGQAQRTERNLTRYEADALSPTTKGLWTAS